MKSKFFKKFIAVACSAALMLSAASTMMFATVSADTSSGRAGVSKLIYDFEDGSNSVLWSLAGNAWNGTDIVENSTLADSPFSTWKSTYGTYSAKEHGAGNRHGFYLPSGWADAYTVDDKTYQRPNALVFDVISTYNGSFDKVSLNDIDLGIKGTFPANTISTITVKIPKDLDLTTANTIFKWNPWTTNQTLYLDNVRVEYYDGYEATFEGTETAVLSSAVDPIIQDNTAGQTSITLPTATLDDGKTLAGWATEADPDKVIPAGTEVTLEDDVTYYAVANEKPAYDTPAAPTASATTTSSITLTAMGSDYVYSMDSTTWQSSNVFTGLAEDTEYTFYQKRLGNIAYKDSEVSPAATISTDKTKEVGSVDDWNEVATTINSGNTTYSFKITADIDFSGVEFTSLGTSSNPFCGTIDGQGHTLKGISSSNGVVNYAQGGLTIKNLRIDSTSSFSASEKFLGAFVDDVKADGTGAVTIENCVNSASVTCGAENAAAFIGCVTQYPGPTSIIKNCVNTGAIKGSKESGIFSGWLAANSSTVIENCYNIGTIDGVDSNKRLARGTYIIKNVYDIDKGADATDTFDAETLLMSDGTTKLLDKLNGNIADSYKAGDDNKPLPSIFVKDVDDTTIDISMRTGASIRLTDKTGIRFYTIVDTAKVAELRAAGYTVELGTIIAPADNFKDKDITLENGKDGKDYVNVKFESNEYFTENGTDYVVGSLVGINPNNITKNFVGRGYVTVSKDGVEETYYATYENDDVSKVTRSVQYVAGLFKEDATGENATEAIMTLYNNNKDLVDAWADGKAYTPTTTE